MGDIVDFNKKKLIKENEKTIEDEFTKFLNAIHQNYGVPHNTLQWFQHAYNSLRYFEGSLRCFPILNVISPLNNKDKEHLKQTLIIFLQELITEVETL